MTTIPKPYSAACDRNRDPILEVLRRHFADRKRVLEIGSGTGQHAVYFAAALAHLTWQTTERTAELDGVRAWLAEAHLPNTPAPLTLDVREGWPVHRYDAVFTANTLHIMSWDEVRTMFEHLPDTLAEDAKVAVHGPFNYGGRFTSESNQRFDASLRARVTHMGIRDFEAVNELARSIGLTLLEDLAMPANNRTLVWQRSATKDA
jgi:cyclopropane fatty-acyl-phospholipid synthase-like methyltransferase